MKTNFNRTRIIATLGPASGNKEMLLKMAKAGMDVCRINFSHGNHDKQQLLINLVRELNNEYGLHLGILADLQGPKIRIGEVENNGVILENNKEVIISTKPLIGTNKLLYITYSHFPKDVATGDAILLDDGKLRLKVLSTDRKTQVRAKVIHGGLLSSNKGVNLPNTKISSPSLTEKDLEDLQFALKNDIEWIGLSFVRSPKDIISLKEIVQKSGKKCRVLAKIEKPEALEHIDEIIAVSDAVMVARGDLGVEMPMERVPGIQKQIVAKCIKAAKPVIVATQMMESMITNANPTRAEANDVANSVLDGADAVMLSAETSVGKFPLLVVEAMQRIISSVEEFDYRYAWENPPNEKSPTYLSDAICHNACTLAQQTNAAGIVSLTTSGYTAFQLSSHRPKAPIYIFTSNRSLLNALSLIWGVKGTYYDKFVSSDATIKEVNEILVKAKYLKKGDVVINTGSIPLEEKGKTNMLKVSVVK